MEFVPIGVIVRLKASFEKLPYFELDKVAKLCGIDPIVFTQFVTVAFEFPTESKLFTVALTMLPLKGIDTDI